MYPAPNSDSFITMSLVVTIEMHISRLSNLHYPTGLFFPPSKALKVLSRDTSNCIFCSESFLAYIYCLSHGLLAKLSTPLHQIHTGAFIKNGLIKKLSGLFFTNTNHQDSLVFVYGPSQNKYTLAYREFISNNRIWGRLLQLISFTLAFALVMPRFEPAGGAEIWCLQIARKKKLCNETPVHFTTQMWKQEHKKSRRWRVPDMCNNKAEKICAEEMKPPPLLKAPIWFALHGGSY